MLGSKIQVALKYCGACNPYIELSKIANELKEALKKETDLKPVSSESNHIDTMIILCGCPRACGNKPEIRDRAAQNIVVAGETVDMVPIPQKDISAVVIKKLKAG